MHSATACLKMPSSLNDSCSKIHQSMNERAMSGKPAKYVNINQFSSIFGASLYTVSSLPMSRNLALY